MGNLKQNFAKGFTTLELVVVIAVIGVLASITFSAISDSRAKGRDTQRITDIDTIQSRLEEYHADKGGYPNTLTTALLYNLDPDILKDPNGLSITIHAAAANQVAAEAVADPTASGASYSYVPYPTGCTAITCTGYILKSYIEKPNAPIPNPYVKPGLNNN